MPIPDEMVERVNASKIADLLQHDWIRWGGGLYAAAFLREFTGDVPWAHLDIAGPAYNSGSASGHLTPAAPASRSPPSSSTPAASPSPPTAETRIPSGVARPTGIVRARSGCF